MGIYTSKPKWQALFQPLGLLCERYHIHPDLLTYGALGVAGVAGLAFSQAATNPAWLWLVPPCLLLRLGLNIMDGMVARGRGLASPWGEVKNEFGDRVADTLIFLGLGYGGYVEPFLVTLTLALILCVSYLGILSKAVGGLRVYDGIFAKGDRMISLAVFTFYPLLSGHLTAFFWYLVVAVIASIITIIQRLKVIYVTQQPLS